MILCGIISKRERIISDNIIIESPTTHIFGHIKIAWYAYFCLYLSNLSSILYSDFAWHSSVDGKHNTFTHFTQRESRSSWSASHLCYDYKVNKRKPKSNKANVHTDDHHKYILKLYKTDNCLRLIISSRFFYLTSYMFWSWHVFQESTFQVLCWMWF